MVALLLLLLVLLLSVLPSSIAEKDSQVYPWGDNPNTKYKMYWKDSPNILEDLSEFSSLYIRVHHCVWSEYGLGTSYDDDGENHDGDENWYMTRYQPFRANAAFSLYGVLRGETNFGRNCRKKTYINTFFTYLGADSLLEALGTNISAFPDEYYGSAYCYEAQQDGEGSHDSHDHRELGSNSGDQDGGMSMTMGCSADGDFVIAKFQGDDCDGMNFLNGTEEYLDDYNNAMDSVQCTQIWKRRKYIHSGRRLEDAQQGDDDDGNSYVSVYGSPAELILSTSFACDVDLFPDGQCPDPYGLKAEYAMNLERSAKRNSPVRVRNWQTPMRAISWVLVVAAVGLMGYAYVLSNKRSIRSKGGGAKGVALQAGEDLKRSIMDLGRRKPQTPPRTSKKKKKSSKDSGVATEETKEDTDIVLPPSKFPSKKSTEKNEIV